MAFYTGPLSNTSNNNEKKNKNYIDMVIDKTEKIKFDNPKDNCKESPKVIAPLIPKNSFADQNKKGMEQINSNIIQNNNKNLSEDIIIQPDINIKGPRNLNQIKTKTYQGDKTFLLQSHKVDTHEIKSKIDENIESNKEIMNDVESNRDDLTKKFEELQKEKQEKLKEYRDMLVKSKKEKRNADKEKDDPFEIDEGKLSDEVRKRLLMRKQLAESLKK